MPDGESIADAEARVGKTIGPVMLKLELTAAYAGSGKTVLVTATRADGGGSRVLTGYVPAGAASGDVFPLDWGPHSDYPGPWYTDVTAFAESAGDGYLACKVVNDGPSHRADGIEVTRAAYTPFAVDVPFGFREPYLAVDSFGVIHCVYIRDGEVLRRSAAWGATAFSEPDYVSRDAGWVRPCRRPCILPRFDGSLLASATTADVTKFWTSKTGGNSWQTLGSLSTTLASYVYGPSGLMHLVGVSGSGASRVMRYYWSDTQGQTWQQGADIATIGTSPPSIAVLPTGWIVTQGRVADVTRTYVSKDGGDSWALAGGVGP